MVVNSNALPCHGEGGCAQLQHGSGVIEPRILKGRSLPLGMSEKEKNTLDIAFYGSTRNSSLLSLLRNQQVGGSSPPVGSKTL